MIARVPIGWMVGLKVTLLLRLKALLALSRYPLLISNRVDVFVKFIFHSRSAILASEASSSCRESLSLRDDDDDDKLQSE